MNDISTPFDSFADSDLTPLELAERDWMRADIEVERAMNTMDMNPVVLKQLKEKRMFLWKRWVGLKPYLSEAHKIRLGITIDPNFAELTEKGREIEARREKKFSL